MLEEYFESFVGELEKLAGAPPIMNRLSKDPEKAEEQVKNKIRSSDFKVLGYNTVVLPKNKNSDAFVSTFKRTRLSVPLPGERGLPVTFRRGPLHAHEVAGHYLVHEDKTLPKGLSRSVKHLVLEGPPALGRRIRGTIEPEYAELISKAKKNLGVGES